ncbi:DUF4249 domain-containing protein [Pontibacter korlensis]|uniref:DUF4249 domain-containing protein n=1 Tax=Pontibacter korlensis TaxID=400092 RepID=A0A0E3UVH7_9BACT|nr:DUF4249 domain-containing protein [Pontibacter korlensis]AKD02537.1 hypothetical protein PKOR_04590 [Pontibacter korlensis]
MLRVIFPLVLLLLAVGCIDPIDFDHKDQQRHLVIEGSFTNDPEHNYVRLSHAKPYSDQYSEYEKKASVAVYSSDGNEKYEFEYDSATTRYYPIDGAAAYGKPGKTYMLHIDIGDSVYQSPWITMPNPIPVEKVHFEMDEQLYAFKGDREKTRFPGYKVLVDYQDPAGEKNFLRWSFVVNYEVFTQPWYYIDAYGNPKPKDCCAKCLLTEKLDRFKVVDDRLTDGNKVINQEVLFMPFYRYFGVKHGLKVYQYAVTEEAYNFYRIMEQQKEATGTVFDPPPARVVGNMYNVRYKSEQVIGFFDVSAVTTNEITVLRDEINHDFLPYQFPDDCRELPGSTAEFPADW